MNRSGFLSRAGLPGWFVWLLALVLWAPTALRAQDPTREIVINEVLAVNNTYAVLEEFPDYFPDYIELHNQTTEPIDLGAGGYALSRKRNPSPVDPEAFFFFEPGTVIGPDAYLLVFMDNNTNFPGVHATFVVGGTNRVTLSLSGSGEYLKLVKGVGLLPPFYTLVDTVLFGFQVPDYSIGRFPDFSGDFTLTLPTPGLALTSIPNRQTNTPAFFVPAPVSSNEFTVKINEWLSTNSAGADKDWLELYNPTTNIVQLSGLILTDDKADVVADGNTIKANSYIGPLGFVQVFADDDGDAPDAVNFSISSSKGDILYVWGTNGLTVIDIVKAALGKKDISEGRLPDGGTNITVLPRRSPEDSNWGTIAGVVINEVLTHTDPPLEDAVELMSTTNVNINLSGWWLSNNRDNPFKYKIPSGTILPANGYIVFYERDFNGPNATQPFTMNSANGDELYIFQGDSSGRLLGYRRGVDFGAAANGVSFGRFTNQAGQVDFTALSDLSFGTSVRAGDPVVYTNIFRTGTGAANAYARVGPIVVNEIHYNPGVGDETNEFIELFNISDQTVPLYDPLIYRADRNYNPAPDGTVVLRNEIYADGKTNTWRIRGGAEFNFPENISLGAGKFLLIVNFDPDDTAKLNAFTNKFHVGGVPGQVQVFGPFRSGKLKNGGDNVELLRPDAPQGPQHPDFRLVPRIRIDNIVYNNKEPWPTTAAGGGDSLQRISSYAYGNDPSNWKGEAPTPGRFNTQLGIESPTISKITLSPSIGTVSAGGTISATVTARGGGLNYQWYFNDNPMIGQNAALLRLQNASTNQTGPYYVIVDNLAGSATSSIVTLTITESKPDSSLPSVAVTSPSAATITDPAIVVRGTAKDNIGVNSVFYSVNGGSFLSATGSVKWTVWGSPLPVILEPGTNIVRAYALDQAGNNSATNAKSYFQSVRSPLLLSTNGLGGVRGATNGQGMELGRNFTLTATPAANNVFSNWIVMTNANVIYVGTSPTLTYMMRPDLEIIANFVANPFIGAAGKYNGLFYNEGDFDNASSGFFTLAVTDRGSYTASLLNDGRKVSSSGQLDLDGNSTKSVIRKGTNDIVVSWSVNLHGSNTVSGSVSNAAWTASLQGDRAVYSKTAPYTNVAKYTFTIPGVDGDDSKPKGDGYGTASIDASGNVNIKGFLADKTAISQKVPISQSGEWPFFVQLYSKKGSAFGWLHLIDTPLVDFEGDVHWFKPASTAKYYPAGFEVATTMQGSRYVAPVGTNRVLNMTSGTVTFSGGDFAQDYASHILLGLSSKVTNDSVHRLTFSFTLPTGLFKGNFTPTNGTKATVFNGAVLQKSTNGLGFFQGTNLSGRVTLEVAP